jgi:uncharacterized repeat protein (TIGR01451 family)
MKIFRGVPQGLRRLFGRVSGLLPVVLVAVISWSAIAGPPVERQTVHVRLPAAIAGLQPIGAMDRSQRLNLAIGLPLRNPGALNQLLRDIYDPASPNYHHYLTPEQFTERFGPTEQDYQAVIAFAKANGLTVTTLHPNRMLVDVSASVGDIERALHVNLQEYHHPSEARAFYAPDKEPTLDLAVPILSIGGLNSYSLPRPRLKQVERVNGKAVTPNASTGPLGGYIGRDFRTAYVPGTTLDGTGQVVGLLQFDGYTASDIAYYQNLAGLPSVTITNVLINGASGDPSYTGGEVEVSLDIEMAISMAPGLSQVMVYEAPNPSPFEDLLNRMATDNLARQLSCSWYLPGGMSSPVADQIFQQMAAQGQSFFNASGDYDAYTGLIDFPGDTPYITEVGGTTLTTGSDGAYVSETVWNRGNGIGSGGGISTQYPIPGWQTNINMSANQGSATMRNIPDVALTAENVYVRADGSDQTVGGTSCAAPLWAGFAALVNQQAGRFGKPSIGFVNPVLYAMGSTSNYPLFFHDITTGDNTSSGSPNKFHAAPGYDLCTGLGTPSGQKLIDAFVPPVIVMLPVSATEGDGLLAAAGQVVLPVAWPTNVVVTLNSSDPAQVSVPASITISAGQTNGIFDLTILDAGVLDGTQTATVTALLPGGETSSASMSIFDKETAVLQVTVPTPVIKGQGVVWGTVQVSAPVAADVSVTLSSDATNLLQVPSSVIIPTGQTSTVFQTTILTDGRINGGQTVTVTAHVQNWTGGTTAVAVQDNLNLTVTLPATAWENAGVLTNAGSVSLAGTSTVSRVISLISDKLNKLTVPPAVTILAGSLSNTFNVTLVDNSVADGHQTVVVTAGTPGFTNGSASMLVLDNESPPLPSNPRPGNFATNVPANTNLMWSNGEFLTNQLVLNGDFETGTLTNWVETDDTGYGDWIINNGTYLPPGPGGQEPPFAGNFSAMSEQSGGGTRTLYQDITIPSDANGATLSWVDQICNYASEYNPNDQYFHAEIRGTNNSLLNIAFTTNPGDPLTNNWTARSFNLSAYIGKTIRIAFVESDGLYFFNVGLDNIRVAVMRPSPGQEGVITNDVYFGTNPTPGPGEFRGATTNTSWTLSLLAPQTTYYWQIIAHRIGSAAGPVWQFTTAGVDHFVWSDIPSPQWVNQPFISTITAKDAFNSTVTNFTGTASIQCVPAGGTSGNIEDFESGTWPSPGWVSVSGTTLGTLSSTNAHDGDYGLSDPEWMYRTNFSVGNSGDVLWCWIRPGSGRAYLGFDASSSGCWAVVVAADTGEFFLQQDPDYSDYIEVAGVTQSWQAGKWYRVKVQFNSASSVTCNLYDSDGTTLLNSLSYADVTGPPGGVAIRSFGGFSLDTITSGEPRDNVACSPTNTGNFAGGIWSGSLTVLQPATNVALRADDGQHHHGISNPFDLVFLNDLAITLVDSPHPVSVGANLTYTLVVTNTGPTAATGVMVTNLLPANITFVSATASQGTCTRSGGLVTGNLGVVPGGTSAVITIVVIPPTVGVTLTNVATVTRGEIDGYLGNNTAAATTLVTTPTISIADASCLEGNAGTTNMIFQVTLAVPDGQTITANYATTDGTALAGADYLSTSGLVTFPPGTTNQNIAVAVIGNTMVQPNKTFLVTLSNPINGTLSRNQAVGTIINDDGLPGQLDHFLWSPIASSQLVGQPLVATITAVDFYNLPATNFTGTVQLSAASGQPCIFRADFENGLQGFTINNVFGSGNGLWHVSTGRGSDAGHSPVHSLYYGRNEGPAGGGNYDNGLINGGIITSPAITLPPGVPMTLSFNYLMDVEPLTNFDQAFVEVSTNQGASYVVVASKGAGLTNLTGGLWVSNSVPLTQFAGQTILLRFRFDTIDNIENATEGWYLDDIVIQGSGSVALPLVPAQTGAFAAGSWTGTVTVQQAAANVFLLANDTIGHSGLANPFDVTSSGILPAITLQPTNQLVVEGQTTLFRVGANGSQPLSYHWTFNHTNIAGATNASLILPGVHPDAVGTYAVWVTNLYGSTLSSNATLTVIVPVTNCVTASSGLVSWWSAEGNAYDAVGTNNGVVVGSVGYNNGEAGQAFQFDGSGGYISIPASASLNIGTGSGVTVEGWIQPNDPGQIAMSVVGWESSLVEGLQMWIGGSGLGLSANVKDTSGNNHAFSSSTGLISTNYFQHVALTYDRNSGTALLYVNGAQVASTNLGSITPQTAYPLYLGRLTTAGGPYQGLMDEISVYNRALYSNEIAAIYNAGIYGKCTPDPLMIDAQPNPRAVLPGCYALFGVQAEGSGPLSYQWRKDGVVLTMQTNSTLLLTNVQSYDFGYYSVVVSDAVGSVTSSPAMLSLGHPPVAHPDVIERFAAGGVRINASNLVTNDTDADGDALRVIEVSPSGTAGGVVGLTNNWIYYEPPASGSNTDTFTYIVDDGGCGTDVGTVTVQVKPDNLQPQNFAGDNPGDGSALVRFDGIPGATYRILYTDSLTAPNWQTLTDLTADSFGVCQFLDWSPTNAPARFYRAVRP